MPRDINFITQKTVFFLSYINLKILSDFHSKWFCGIFIERGKVAIIYFPSCWAHKQNIRPI